MNNPPSVSVEAILVQSDELPSGTPVAKGYDFNDGVNYENLFATYKTCGFQATNLGLAIEEVAKMIAARTEQNCKIFLSFTSNMMISGVRENIKFLVKHKLIDYIVTTADAIENDIMRCLGSTFIGDFHMNLKELKKNDLEFCKVGNLLIPRKNYSQFETWFKAVLNKFLKEQTNNESIWNSAEITARLGCEINDENSVLFWAQKNQIPVFCPSFTDGNVIGKIIAENRKRNRRLKVDLVEDLDRIYEITANGNKAGIIVIGGSSAQSHICRSMRKRSGADYAVFISTGCNFDGSDSGADLSELISQGIIKETSTPVKICAEASLVFPILMAETFVKHFYKVSQTVSTSSLNLSSSSVEFPLVNGYDFSQGINYERLFESYRSTGLQATQLGLAIEEVLRMLSKREDKMSGTTIGSYEEDEFIKVKNNCTIFLGYTSNMISSGIRDTIRFLVQHKMIDCVVTTAGGIEEDLIKCLAPTYIGDFHLDGRKLREKGINRIGNLLVPNKNYCRFEDWIIPIFDQLLLEQNTNGISWTPSTIIARLGRDIDDESSVCYWAQKNKIPVFCPALTDGSTGDMMFFHAYKNPGLKVDIAQDIKRINSVAVGAVNSGMIILGGSVMKHHICNANLMRNGADYSVFINTGCDYDGSDSGALPDEAISWGKIKKDAKPVKVFAEASLVFPVLVAETFAKKYHKNLSK